MLKPPVRSRDDILAIVACTPLLDADPRKDPEYFRRVAKRQLALDYGLNGDEPDLLDMIGQRIVMKFIDGTQTPITINMVTSAPAQAVPSQVTPVPAPLPRQPSPRVPPPTVPKPPNLPPPPAQVTHEEDEPTYEEEHLPDPPVHVLDLPELRMPTEVYNGPEWLKYMWDVYVGEHRWECTYRETHNSTYTKGDTKRGGTACKVIFTFDPRKATKTGATPFKGIAPEKIPPNVSDFIAPKEASGETAHHFTFFKDDWK